ncbi:hypothetical protein AGMMS49944_31540 [Spirochaetia bacterium]|nr:hypothetical protein AGMMS49944_31540 [Spirochaetia bacterium]
MFNFFRKKQKNDSTFNILDLNSWKLASTKSFLWNNKTLPDKDGNPLTEYDIMNLFHSIFAFLERNGDIVPLEKKIDAIKRKLDGMEKVQDDPEYYIRQKAEKEAEDDKKIPDGLFNPRDPKTYQFAKHKPLIIDGVPIYSEMYKDDIPIRETVTEKHFAESTSGKLTFELKNNPDLNVQEYIDRHIKMKLDICSPMPPKVKTAGGYGFTVAQLEVLGDLSDKVFEAIGKTMTSGMRGGKLKQALFNAHGSLNRDWYFLVELHDINIAWEKRVMWDFLVGYEFETKEEVYECYNSIEYLKSYPDMKEELIKSALEQFET